MEVIITDNPKTNMQRVHNMAYIHKDNGWVTLRGFGENGKDIDLIDYCKQFMSEEYKEMGKDEFDELMTVEWFDEPMYPFYWLAVGAAHLREKLKRVQTISNG